jgi:hypothetical protein
MLPDQSSLRCWLDEMAVSLPAAPAMASAGPSSQRMSPRLDNTWRCRAAYTTRTGTQSTGASNTQPRGRMPAASIAIVEVTIAKLDNAREVRCEDFRYACRLSGLRTRDTLGQLDTSADATITLSLRNLGLHGAAAYHSSTLDRSQPVVGLRRCRRSNPSQGVTGVS